MELEKTIKEKIKELLNSDGLLKATINIRNKKSMINNKKYKTMYLIYFKKGKKTIVYVPRESEEKIKKWVINYKKIQKNLIKISDIYIKKILKKTKKHSNF